MRLTSLPVRFRVPLLVCGLLLAGAAVSTWVTYVELRRAALAGAAERLHGVTAQLTDMLVTAADRLKVNAARLAADPALVALAAAPGTARAARARAALDSAVSDSGPVLRLELVTADGDRLVTAGATAPPVHPEALRALTGSFVAGDSGVIGGFGEAGDTVSFTVAAPVPGGDRPAAWLLEHRRVASTPEGARQLRELIGPGAALFVGAGGGWTDLAGPAPPPPLEVTGAEGAVLQYQRPDAGWQLAMAGPVPGTPWTVLLEFPRGPILADAHAVATRLALLTGAAALVGLLIAWTLTRRTMQPLAELAEASRAIAAGDPARRMRARSGDEFGEVADAFNRMAAQVEQARARLEEQVEQRTRELRASEAQFHTLAATAHDAIVMADAAGRITYFNPAAERSFGWSAAEVCGQLLTLLMPDRFHTAHLEGLQRYAATGRARILGRTLELTARRRDGTEFPVELSIASLGAAGAAGFAGILRDVTERRLAHDALRRSEAELRVANAELEAFSYSVSHDLRAPLRSIDGFSQALLEDAGEALPPPAREHLERVRAASQRMARLIDDLLALAQVTRTELASERVDLSALAREVVADLRRHRERDVEVTVAPGLEANGDRQLLRLVFENLIGNAWKFTAGRPGARIDVGAERLNGATVFHVRDNGAGFDMTFAHKLFTPFQRLHGQAEFEGTGIGLATVQRVVHRHGGRVWAEGEVGRGATVRFTLDPSGPQENPHGS